MTRIKRRRKTAYGTEVVVDRSLVKNLMAAAGQAGFRAREFREVTGTRTRRVLIEWDETPKFDDQQEASKHIDSFLDDWDAASR